MKVTITTLGKYLDWYCFFNQGSHTPKETAKEISDYAFVADWNLNVEHFVQINWDSEVLIIECEEGNGSNNGAHDVAIVFDDTILKLDSIDYAFTPMEKSKAI